MDEIKHLETPELEASLDHLAGAPGQDGELLAIVTRPASEQRVLHDSIALSPEGGLDGDSWATRCHLHLEDGRSHPDVQVTIMNSRMTQLIAQQRSRWALAGDQIYADFDVSKANLPVGQRLAIGTAVLEITAEPHLGCKKFAHRFGNDALRFVNSERGKELRLRGVYARIVEAGTIAVGDRLKKLPAVHDR